MGEEASAVGVGDSYPVVLEVGVVVDAVVGHSVGGWIGLSGRWWWDLLLLPLPLLLLLI